MRDNIWCSRNTCPKCPIGSGQKEHPRYLVWAFPTWKPTWASLQGSQPTWRRWREGTPWSQYNRSCLCRMYGTRDRRTAPRCHSGRKAYTCPQTWEGSVAHWDSLAWIPCTTLWLYSRRIWCGTWGTPGPPDSVPACSWYSPSWSLSRVFLQPSNTELVTRSVVKEKCQLIFSCSLSKARWLAEQFTCPADLGVK